MSFEIGLKPPALTNGPCRPKKYVPIQIAIQLSMIVEITSCAPVVAFRKPAIPPQTAPASDRGDDREEDVQRARDAAHDEPMITAA